ncbi:MAG: MFS transporter [Acidaminococcus intestini]|uniref:MFS transporter n=1 Tax=Acidaminococcus intestini TaxID=187327 RepID=A0A943EF88_9FIRM|nr:MFS transporter [Acidaminococcus intestini]
MQSPSQPSSGSYLFFCGLSAVLLYGISGGIRSDIGILLEPLREATGLSYGGLSFAIAILQLSFGFSQPFWGLLAARRSHRFVLLSGVGLFLLGLLGLSLVHSLLGLVLTLGLCLGCGAGAISFGLLLEAVIFAVGPQKGALVSGFINAAAGLGSTFFSPLLSWLSLIGGIPAVSIVLSLIMVGTLPFLFYLTRPPKNAVHQEKGPISEASFSTLLLGALKRPEFRYLLGAFMTCGFHMALIEAHLFSQLLSYGLQRPHAAHAFAAYGLSTVIGALISGFLSVHISKSRLLAIYYGFRAGLIVTVLFFLPKTFLSALFFCVGLGLFGGATVTPTSGIVTEHFPLAQSASLVGLLFLGHQLGAFLSAFWGGMTVAATGSYQSIWGIDSVLCLLASYLSAKILPHQQKNTGSGHKA